LRVDQRVADGTDRHLSNRRELAGGLSVIVSTAKTKRIARFSIIPISFSLLQAEGWA
jgi:hypothetical protein